MPTSAQGGWAAGPASPCLLEGTVHVWRAELTAAMDELGELLSPEELARAERMRSEHRRRLWIRSRAVLRALLGRYLGTDPATLRFIIGTHGKPALRTDWTTATSEQESPISFNLSHSGGSALYALSRAGVVGVDLELIRRSVDVLGIAARTFGAEEAKRLRELDPPSREREFIRSWVRHEAELKCLGVGLSAMPATGEECTPWIVDLNVGPRAAAAVALEAEPRELRCWDWPGSAGHAT